MKYLQFFKYVFSDRTNPAGIPLLHLREECGVIRGRSRYPLLRGIIRPASFSALRFWSLGLIIVWSLRLLPEAPLFWTGFASSSRRINNYYLSYKNYRNKRKACQHYKKTKWAFRICDGQAFRYNFLYNPWGKNVYFILTFVAVLIVNFARWKLQAN